MSFRRIIEFKLKVVGSRRDDPTAAGHPRAPLPVSGQEKGPVIRSSALIDNQKLQ
jgi:hypothetical protein